MCGLKCWLERTWNILINSRCIWLKNAHPYTLGWTCSYVRIWLLKLLEHFIVCVRPMRLILGVIINVIHDDLRMVSLWVWVNVRRSSVTLVKHIPRIDINRLSMLLCRLRLVQHRWWGVQVVPYVTDFPRTGRPTSLPWVHDAVDTSWVQEWVVSRVVSYGYSSSRH